MVDFNKDDGFCDSCRTEQEIADYLVGRLRGNTAVFNKEFMPLIELLTASTAPLMSLMEAKNRCEVDASGEMGAIRMAALSLMLLGHKIDTLIQHAGYFAIDGKHSELTSLDGNQSCDDWDL